MSAPALDSRELACVLAALRLWQDRNLPDGLHPRRLLDLEQVIARESGPSLDTEEIDALCERLNLDEVKETPRVVIEVKGGCVVAVYCSDASASVAVMDRDNLEDAEADTDDKSTLAALEDEISILPEVL